MNFGWPPEVNGREHSFITFHFRLAYGTRQRLQPRTGTYWEMFTEVASGHSVPGHLTRMRTFIICRRSSGVLRGECRHGERMAG